MFKVFAAPFGSAFTLICLVFIVTQPAWGADDSDAIAALTKQVEALNAGQNDLKVSLRVIRDLLMGKQPPLEGVFVNLSGSPSLGNADAAVVIVEFTDFQCPYCKAYHRDTFGRILNEYIKTGQIRYISRNFPLEEVHPLAEKAAEAALCAAEQGRYWEAHDRFFADQERLALADIPDHAHAIGADPLALQQCLASGKYEADVGRDVSEGQDLGVRGTPTFFVGYSLPGDSSRIQAVRSIGGNAPFREFQRAIQAASALANEKRRANP